MAPVATTEKENGNGVSAAKEAAQVLFNPFYSPPSMDENDGDYKYAHYKVILRPVRTLCKMKHR